MSDPGGSTTVDLVPGWDAALTYDVLAGTGEAPVFVGREDLLGPLVNAISRPDRRGTYLVSGYRGAGKTSLVIEAARRAKPKLEQQGRRLLPLVLNVSEVSASLESAGEQQMPKLGIDARRLLTALLRALRNGLPEGDPVARKVLRAYDKAEASQYSETAQQRAEMARSVKTETKRTVTVANALKLVGAVAGIGLAGVIGGTLLGAVPGVCIALAGVIGVSFTASRMTSTSTSDSSATSTELVFDNSLHQVESDLKDILAALDEHHWRTLFVLEELDKVEDADGQQLDAVIRYFKNLFTQAPALFFFLTDKEYYDIIGENIRTARRDRSYAVEHTFFTHRVFVSRPSLDECLAYFRAVLGEEAQPAVEQIASTRQVRSLALSEMTEIERFLRVLLFWSQNHLFDLKNEMRRYVRVDDSGSRLAFDADSLPPQEQAVAALQFLLEQKAQLYRFGGGRDYENEVLRNCLSGVFWNLGGEEPQPLAGIYPTAAELKVTEHARVVEAVDSLLGDLARGGAIERRSDDFSWRPNAAVAFTPAPRLETHEQALKDQVEIARRVCEQFGAGPLTGIVDADAVKARIAEQTETIEEILRASRPLTIEDAQARSAAVQNGLAALLADAEVAHLGRLAATGWSLVSDGSGVVVATRGEDGPPRVLLVYRAGAEVPLRLLAGLPEGKAAAVVIVEPDPAIRHPALLRMWRDALAQAGRPVLVTSVSLDEGLKSPADVAERWGERTAEELVFARIWLGQRDVFTPSPPAPAWLATGTQETRFDSLAEALAAWLAGPEPLLGAPPAAGNHPETLRSALAELAPRSDRPAVLLDGTEWLPPPIVDDDRSVRQRLIEAGRAVTLVNSPQIAPSTRSILWVDAAPTGLAPDVVRTLETPQSISAVAEFVEPFDQGRAGKLLEQAAAGGDAWAMARMAMRGDSQEWVDRLLATGDWAAIARAGEALPPADGLPLLQAAADAGNTEALASLLIMEPSRELAERLTATGEWVAVRRAGQALSQHELGPELLGAAAGAGDLGAIDALVHGGWTAYDEKLLAEASAFTLWRIALRLDPSDPERGLRFHRAAAAKGDVDSMREVLVRGGEEESRANQARLAEMSQWDRLEEAAAALDDARAEQIRAQIAAGKAREEAA